MCTNAKCSQEPAASSSSAVSPLIIPLSFILVLSTVFSPPVRTETSFFISRGTPENGGKTAIQNAVGLSAVTYGLIFPREKERNLYFKRERTTGRGRREASFSWSTAASPFTVKRWSWLKLSSQSELRFFRDCALLRETRESTGFSRERERERATAVKLLNLIRVYTFRFDQDQKHTTVGFTNFATVAKELFLSLFLFLLRT